MRFQKAIKKIMALGTGATMMGATVMGAFAAADLTNYPAPFIKDGKFTGVLVVGDRAAAEDVIGVSDIAVSLQFAATKPAGSGTSVTAQGEAWKVGTSTKILEMAESVTSGSFETIANITTLSYLRSVTDVSMLGDLHALDISCCEGITDVSALGKLHTLKMSECVGVTDVSMLRGLHVLDISKCLQIRDISAFTGVYDELNISGCNITKKPVFLRAKILKCYN